MSQRIRTREASFNGADLWDLLNDDILALVIKSYYEPAQCERLATRIAESEAVEQYTHEVVNGPVIEHLYFGVDRLGFPFNAVYGATDDGETVARYYREASEVMRRMRRLSSPALAPIDKLRLDLDEQFLPGATVAAFQGRKMLAGIGRITKAALSHLSAEEPHFDGLPEFIRALDVQVAANIYLQVPDAGGELELWDVRPSRPLDPVPAKWRSLLPASLKIKPERGDLILFNCRRPHAIGAFEGEDRITVQMFIGYQRGEPLQLWN